MSDKNKKAQTSWMPNITQAPKPTEAEQLYNAAQQSLGFKAARPDFFDDYVNRDRVYDLTKLPQEPYIKQMVDAWLGSAPSVRNIPYHPAANDQMSGYIYGNGKDGEFNTQGVTPIKTPTKIGMQAATVGQAFANQPYGQGVLGHELTHTNQLTSGRSLDDQKQFINSFPEVFARSIGPDEKGIKSGYSVDSPSAEKEAEIVGQLIKNLMYAKAEDARTPEGIKPR